MVLNALGAQLTAAFSRLSKAASVDDEAIKALLAEISRALISADVNAALVVRLRTAVTERLASLPDDTAFNRARQVERLVAEELVHMLDPGKEPFKPRKGKSNVIMFVGLQGAGKTTTVAKYAHYYQQRKWRVAMVCADTFRAGAFDQLKQNATRVRVPFYGSYEEADPVRIAAEGVAQFKEEGYEIIIVDTSGRHMQEAALFEEMRQVQAAVEPDDIVFVMDSSIGQAARAQAEAFRATVPVGSVVITKLDGHAKGGGALSAVAATGSPIVFLGVGEHFDDLQPFDAQRFIGKLLGKGDLAGLVQEIKEKGIMDNPALAASLQKGKFSLRDMREQVGQMMKLGSMGKILEAMPGPMGQMMQQLQGGAGGPGGALDGASKFKRWITLMDSMTAAELDGDVELDEGRQHRICRGAGAHPGMLGELLQAFKMMEKMMGNMSKSGILRNEAALSKAMKRDPKAVMAQLQRNMDPSILAQVGGVGNLMKMMEAMEGSDGAAPGGGGKAGKAGKGGGGGLPGIPPGMGGMGGMPDLGALAGMMGSGGGGGLPGGLGG